jgi:predicted ArsR family transcriptional regulator
LAEPARRRVWDAIRTARRPLGVADLASGLAVHPNTVRLHLARLVDAGLVIEELESTRHRGRPGYRYRSVGADPVAEASAYRRLAGLLSQAVRAGASAREAGRAAGAQDATQFAGREPVTAIVSALESQGFAPELGPTGKDRIEVVLRECPFAEAAAADPATICQLHLGLAEGAAHAIGGIKVDGLHIADPYQAGCRLLLRPTPQAVRRA